MEMISFSLFTKRRFTRLKKKFGLQFSEFELVFILKAMPDIVSTGKI
jgi:hypothetical protein